MLAYMSLYVISFKFISFFNMGICVLLACFVSAFCDKIRQLQCKLLYMTRYYYGILVLSEVLL